MNLSLNFQLTLCCSNFFFNRDLSSSPFFKRHLRTPSKSPRLMHSTNTAFGELLLWLIFSYRTLHAETSRESHTARSRFSPLAISSQQFRNLLCSLTTPEIKGRSFAPKLLKRISNFHWRSWLEMSFLGIRLRITTTNWTQRHFILWTQSGLGRLLAPCLCPSSHVSPPTENTHGFTWDLVYVAICALHSFMSSVFSRLLVKVYFKSSILLWFKKVMQL